jgi:leader peptidase (prepilin peptidase)/N-methyltransferase
VVLEWLATPAVLFLVGTATVTDLRRREVPTWLTVGGGLAGLLVAAVYGWQALAPSLPGLAVGGLLLLPLVRAGGFDAGDALLLAAIGAWLGWQLVLWTAWWAAVVGAGLALVARRHGQRTIPYVPAVALGAALAFVTS